MNIRASELVKSQNTRWREIKENTCYQSLVSTFIHAHTHTHMHTTQSSVYKYMYHIHIGVGICDKEGIWGPKVKSSFLQVSINNILLIPGQQEDREQVRSLQRTRQHFSKGIIINQPIPNFSIHSLGSHKWRTWLCAVGHRELCWMSKWGEVGDWL